MTLLERYRDADRPRQVDQRMCELLRRLVRLWGTDDRDVEVVLALIDTEVVGPAQTLLDRLSDAELAARRLPAPGPPAEGDMVPSRCAMTGEPIRRCGCATCSAFRSGVDARAGVG